MQVSLPPVRVTERHASSTCRQRPHNARWPQEVPWRESCIIIIISIMYYVLQVSLSPLSLQGCVGTLKLGDSVSLARQRPLPRRRTQPVRARRRLRARTCVGLRCRPSPRVPTGVVGTRRHARPSPALLAPSAYPWLPYFHKSRSAGVGDGGGGRWWGFDIRACDDIQDMEWLIHHDCKYIYNSKYNYISCINKVCYRCIKCWWWSNIQQNWKNILQWIWL